MLSVKIVNLVRHQARRNLGMMAPVLNQAAVATDPIQQLFVDKIRDYSEKKAVGLLAHMRLGGDYCFYSCTGGWR